MSEEIRDVAVFFINTEELIMVWNRGAEDMRDCTAQEAIGSSLAMLHKDEQKAQDTPQHNLNKAKKPALTWKKPDAGARTAAYSGHILP